MHMPSTCQLFTQPNPLFLPPYRLPAFPLSAFAAGGRGSAAVRVAGSAKLITSLVPLAQLAHFPFSISRACRILWATQAVAAPPTKCSTIFN